MPKKLYNEPSPLETRVVSKNFGLENSESLDTYLDKQNRYTSLQASQLHAQGSRAGTLRLVLSPVLRFFKFYVLRLGFLDGIPGLLHISIGCMNSYVKYAKLIELQRQQ